FEHTFPALWVKPEGSESQALTVQGPRVRDWTGEGSGFWSYGQGQFFKQMDGLPGFEEVEFSGTFPLARVRFRKKGFPLEVELCAFNPLIPLDERSSGFPGACLTYRLKNTTDVPVDLSLGWTMMNPIGDSRPETTEDPDRCRNEYIDGRHLRGIRFSNERFGATDPSRGTAAITTTWSTVECLPQWPKGAWFDAVQSFWNEFRETGKVGGAGEPSPHRAAGSLCATTRLAPGAEVDIPFFISWVFPVATKYWGGEDEHRGSTWKPFYATQWETAWDAASEFFERYDELCRRTQAFETALFTSTLPPEVIQSISATASILHSPTVIQLEDGTFWAWEGCSPQEGCCSGTCSHVWNYALTQAFLFPAMQRSMRNADYRNNFNCGPLGKEGAMNFRLPLPLASESKLWHAASDGQLGGIVQLYRDWRLSGDEAMLRELWPSAKRALEYAWVQWDRDRDGLVDGDQHNTYDINFQGPNPLTQFFYLAALKAGEAISRYLGDIESANKYQALLESGQQLTEARLWNGEFFIQESANTESDAPKYQHGHGCLSDQIFGQVSARVAGLGDLVDPKLIETALDAIYKYNFRNPLGNHENLQRVFAVADEPGLILCSWPNGGRPVFPFVYSDEVWTGIEYQVATHLAFEGRVAESLEIVKGIRKRYDGTRRNPWNEFECGSHYARALAAYGLALAFPGFDYDAVERRAAVAKEGRYFFSTPHGWGVAVNEGGQCRFEITEGRLFGN
ncbi:MAG: hypothetical protein IT203_09145, partial [Fimbriimonadaceae bacterium]|nr:hypothetical protein [Fimbriimonadaceae bacterium]